MDSTQYSAGVGRQEPGVLRRFFQWLFCWRVLRRGLFVLACLTTLVGLFYAVENWRGKRVWEQCRRELEAKGQVLDWNAYIPALVPDDQNIFKAPRMTEWFVRGSLLENSPFNSAERSKAQGSLTPLQGSEPSTNAVLVAEVKVVTPSSPRGPEAVDAALRFDDPAAGEQIQKLLSAVVGPCVEGPTDCLVLARPLDQITPAHWVLEADVAPTPKALAELFPHSPVPHSKATSQIGNYLAVGPGGSNQFHVHLNRRIISAAAYLAWTQPQTADFDLMRKALERPFVRMDGDYQRPFERPVPNFVRMRSAAQMLSQRAQCYLLLGHPDAAWHELALVRDMCRMLEAKPGGDCPLLVEAMIDVAINGLYVNVIQDGLRLQGWREPELAAIQKQLGEIDAIPLVQRAFQVERAAVCRTFEAIPPAEWFSSDKDGRGLWARVKDPELLVADLIPRGWIYQNMSAVARLEQLSIEVFDVANNQVLPHRAEENNNQLQIAFKHRTPYTVCAAIAVPNIVRASQTMARNQTLANEAYLACGLERYRLVHGQYPETLAALVPEFAEKVPHDIIGGQPLKYRCTANGKFVLYSVGWNEKDDGGVPGKTDVEGDWVWQ